MTFSTATEDDRMLDASKRVRLLMLPCCSLCCGGILRPLAGRPNTCVSLKQLVVDDSVAVTPFYLLLGKHRQQQEKPNTSSPVTDKPQQPQVSVTIKEVILSNFIIFLFIVYLALK